jgi:hypothetical protein
MWLVKYDIIKKYSNSLPTIHIEGMSESLYVDGYQDQVNIDISKAAIEKMSQHYKDKPSMECKLLFL